MNTKRIAWFVLFLLILSIISGYLLSEVSLVGKIGIKFFYKEYTFLRSWYKGAAAIFVVLILLFMAQLIIIKTARKNVSQIVSVFCIAGALIGLYFTYDDFRHTLSHRWLGERFHLGAYLFWIGWIIVCLYILLQRKQLVIPADKKTDALITNSSAPGQ